MNVVKLAILHLVEFASGLREMGQCTSNVIMLSRKKGKAPFERGSRRSRVGIVRGDFFLLRD